jgi:hypothetical protein
MARKDFVDGLTALGHEPEDRGDGRIVFRYTIPVGKFAGRELHLGFQVADDFPLNPPGGPHFTPPPSAAAPQQ